MVRLGGEGPHTLVWNGSREDHEPLASGLSFVVIQSGNQRHSKAVIRVG